MQDHEIDATSIRQEFEKVGAVIVRGLLSKQEVAAMRQYLDGQFKPLDAASREKTVKSLAPSFCWQSPQIFQAALHERAIQTLKIILEPNFSVLGDLEVHRNLFGLKHEYKASKLFGLIGPGWHQDAGAEGAQDYLFDPNYRMCKCGIYLQDNTVEWGGGIEIVPGAYKAPLRTGHTVFDTKARRLYQAFLTPLKRSVVKLNAGDFVTFHALLPHRGTLPKAALKLKDHVNVEDSTAKLPPEHTKYVIYYNVSRSHCAHTYLEHSFKRAQRDDLIPARQGKKIDMFFSDFPGLRYPNDFHPGAQHLIEANGLKMAQLAPKDLEQAAALRQEIIVSGNALNYLPEWGLLPRSAA